MCIHQPFEQGNDCDIRCYCGGNVCRHTYDEILECKADHNSRKDKK